jgi:hypothetical protein
MTQIKKSITLNSCFLVIIAATRSPPLSILILGLFLPMAKRVYQKNKIMWIPICKLIDALDFSFLVCATFT